MAETVFAALALVLVFEGLLPFFSPTRWRRVIEQVLKLSDGQLRFLGLCAMLMGLALLALLH
jgi:uncharacterized protein YjeT (DUF2065 family)